MKDLIIITLATLNIYLGYNLHALSTIEGKLLLIGDCEAIVSGNWYIVQDGKLECETPLFDSLYSENPYIHK